MDDGKLKTKAKSKGTIGAAHTLEPYRAESVSDKPKKPAKKRKSRGLLNINTQKMLSQIDY